MSLASATSKVAYAGNNSTVTTYAVPFLFLANAHVACVVLDADGVETELELTTDFVLTGAGVAEGGTLRTLAAWDNTHTVTIRRVMPMTQPYVYSEGQRMPMATIEQNMDWLAMQLQTLSEASSRAIHFPASEDAAMLASLGTVEDRKGKVLYFHATTGALTLKTPEEIIALG